MDGLNQMEIQNIRHLVGNMSGICDKTVYYRTLTKDNKVLIELDGVCESATNLKDELIGLFEEV